MIIDNGTLERVIGKLVERCNDTAENLITTDKRCEICGVDEWNVSTNPAEIVVMRYTGECRKGTEHTIERVEMDVDLVFETTLEEKWKETCPDCDSDRTLGDLEIRESNEMTTFTMGIQQVRKTRLEEHHTSYIPEKTIPLCASCHTKVHNKDGFHDELKPDISRTEFEVVKHD